MKNDLSHPHRRAGFVNSGPDLVNRAPRSLVSQAFTVGDSLTVEQRTLTPLVEVRILVPQPIERDRWIKDLANHRPLRVGHFLVASCANRSQAFSTTYKGSRH